MNHVKFWQHWWVFRDMADWVWFWSLQPKHQQEPENAGVSVRNSTVACNAAAIYCSALATACCKLSVWNVTNVSSCQGHRKILQKFLSLFCGRENQMPFYCFKKKKITFAISWFENSSLWGIFVTFIRWQETSTMTFQSVHVPVHKRVCVCAFPGWCTRLF